MADADLDGVFLYADDPARLADWYDRHLGIARTHRVVVDGSGYPPARLQVRGREPATADDRMAISVAVRDVRGTVEHFRSEGVEISGPYQGPEGDYAILHDPAGNLVRLSACSGPWRETDRVAGAWPTASAQTQRKRPAATIARLRHRASRVRLTAREQVQEQPLMDGPPSARGESAEAAVVTALEQRPTPTRVTTGSRRRWVSWLPLVLALIIGAAAVLVTRQNSDPAAQQTVPNAPETVSAPDGDSGVRERSRRVRDGPRMLGITGDWDLFALGFQDLVRIEFDNGRITVTPVPRLSRSGIVHLVLGRRRVLLRPDEPVPGLLVPDDAKTRRLAAGSASGGTSFPGPQLGQMWVPNGSPALLSLVDMQGRSLGVSIQQAPALRQPITGDGRGNVLFSGIGGTYLATPEGVRKVTAGEVVAVGDAAFLAVECAAGARCANVVIDRRTDERRRLGDDLTAADGPIGVVSPDGASAAVIRAGAIGRQSLRLVDLETGQVHALAPVEADQGRRTMAFSPDGRWLFVASRGKLLAFDTRSGRRVSLDVDLPPIEKVAVRQVPGQ